MGSSIPRLFRTFSFVKHQGSKSTKGGAGYFCFVAFEPWCLRCFSVGLRNGGGEGIAVRMLKIVYSDEALVVVNKPTRLLTVPGRGPDKQDCCYHRVLEDFPDALVVHRLDMDTSGLLIFARSNEVQRNLSAQFEARRVKKVYQALVEGVVVQDEGRVDFPMRKDMAHRLPPKHVVDCIRGKKALTEWRVLERCVSETRMALYPQTGRSHQLRVHMEAIGHPIVGDPIYGTGAQRLKLHAVDLEFGHPQNGRVLQLHSPAPF